MDKSVVEIDGREIIFRYGTMPSIHFELLLALALEYGEFKWITSSSNGVASIDVDNTGRITYDNSQLRSFAKEIKELAEIHDEEIDGSFAVKFDRCRSTVHVRIKKDRDDTTEHVVLTFEHTDESRRAARVSLNALLKQNGSELFVIE